MFSFLFFSLAMLSYSCEKETLTSSSTSTEEQAALTEAVNVQVDGPAPAYQSITEIPADLRDGALHFKDIVDVRRTMNTLAEISDEDYRSWAIDAGFNSPYLQYLILREQIEIERRPLKAADITAAQKTFLFIGEDGVPRFKVPYFGLMKITSFKNCIFEVGTTLNYYTPDRHNEKFTRFPRIWWRSVGGVYNCL